MNFIGFMCFLAVSFILREFRGLSQTTVTLVSLAAIAVPLMMGELSQRRVHARESSGLDLGVGMAIDWARVSVKLFGFYATFAIIAALYWLLPEYHHDFYAPFWELLEVTLPVFLFASIPYFIFVDRRMIEPRDGYWHCGMAMLRRMECADKKVLVQYALGWLVKAFFIPLMYVMYMRSYQYFLGVDFTEMISSTRTAYNFFYEFSYLVDLLFACVGYVLTVRLLDTHIRTTESTVKGWLVALVCYEPFWTLVYGSYLTYDNDNFAWGRWLEAYPVTYALWAGTILVFLTVYAASTMTFGLRFSNLTHRGILTNGPYRFCKHPAYVSKNITWWLIAVPFIAEGSAFDAVRDCALLLGVNCIYYLRARTEERHLSWDPVYRQYATLMNDKSIFRGVARWLPFLRYRAE
jgi:hypothetical protein